MEELVTKTMHAMLRLIKMWTIAVEIAKTTNEPNQTVLCRAQL